MTRNQDVEEPFLSGLTLIFNSRNIYTRYSTPKRPPPCLSLKNMPIPNPPNPTNLHLHQIPILQPLRRLHKRRHAPGGPRHNDRAPLQRPPKTQKPDQLRHIEDQIPQPTLLSLLTINPGRERLLLQIRERAGRDENGSEGREFIEGFREAGLLSGSVGELPPSRGNVVADGVAQDVVEGIVGVGEVFRVFGYDDAEFALSKGGLGVRDGLEGWGRGGLTS